MDQIHEGVHGPGVHVLYTSSKAIDPSTVFDHHLGWGADTAKFTVNV